MGKAHGLSQRPDWQVGTERDNKDRVLVKKEWMEVRAMQIGEVIIEEVDCHKLHSDLSPQILGLFQ